MAPADICRVVARLVSANKWWSAQTDREGESFVQRIVRKREVNSKHLLIATFEHNAAQIEMFTRGNPALGNVPKTGQKPGGDK